MDDSVRHMWARFRAANAGVPIAPPAIFHFCDNAEDADMCAALVLAGRKRATAASLAELHLGGHPLPRPGDLAVVTNWQGEAQAIIRTCSVEVKRFADVDECFASAEGEGDGTLLWWRTAHQAYYERVLAGSGHAVDEDLEIACERFELVFAG